MTSAQIFRSFGQGDLSEVRPKKGRTGPRQLLSNFPVGLNLSFRSPKLRTFSIFDCVVVARVVELSEVSAAEGRWLSGVSAAPNALSGLAPPSPSVLARSGSDRMTRDRSWKGRRDGARPPFRRSPAIPIPGARRSRPARCLRQQLAALDGLRPCMCAFGARGARRAASRLGMVLRGLHRLPLASLFLRQCGRRRALRTLDCYPQGFASLPSSPVRTRCARLRMRHPGGPLRASIAPAPRTTGEARGRR